MTFKETEEKYEDEKKINKKTSKEKNHEYYIRHKEKVRLERLKKTKSLYNKKFYLKKKSINPDAIKNLNE